VTIIVLILTGSAALLFGGAARRHGFAAGGWRQAVRGAAGRGGRTPGYGVAAAAVRYTARV
jgi:hypothetical protein